jgi:hypothetical protein
MRPTVSKMHTREDAALLKLAESDLLDSRKRVSTTDVGLPTEFLSSWSESDTGTMDEIEAKI